MSQRLGRRARKFPQARTADQFKQQHDADTGADQHILLCAALQFRKINVEIASDTGKKMRVRARPGYRPRGGF